MGRKPAGRRVVRAGPPERREDRRPLCRPRDRDPHRPAVAGSGGSVRC